MAKDSISFLPSSDLHNTWIESFEKKIEHSVTLIVIPSVDILHIIQHMVKKALEIRGISLSSVSLRDHSVEEVKKNLAASFLGQQLFYWLYDLENIPKQALANIFNYLMSYNGPHVIIMASFAESIVVPEWHGYSVRFPADMNKEEIKAFCATWYKGDAIHKNIEHFFTGYTHVPFNHFASAFPYIRLLGRTLVHDFEKKYLPRILATDAISLFSFMDLFWHKNIRSFYEQWNRVKLLYGNQFWIAFWSEQLFRAYCYAECMKNGHTTIAQQISARKLTFFYIKTAWKTSDTLLLKELHDHVYTLDYVSKNGGIGEMLEYIYMKWFSQQR